MYGKLRDDGTIQYAPRNIKYNNTFYKPAPEWVLIEMGYKEVINTQPEGKLKNFHHWVSEWKEYKNNIKQVWTQEEDDASSKVAYYEQQLLDSDYKVIKSYEYQLAGLDIPYDIDELHAERQQLRDKINELVNN